MATLTLRTIFEAETVLDFWKNRNSPITSRYSLAFPVFSETGRATVLI